MSLRSSHRLPREQHIYEKRKGASGVTNYERHKLGEQLGKGGFATCFVLHDKVEGVENAVKVIPKKNPIGVAGTNYENRSKVQ